MSDAGSGYVSNSLFDSFHRLINNIHNFPTSRLTEGAEAGKNYADKMNPGGMACNYGVRAAVEYITGRSLLSGNANNIVSQLMDKNGPWTPLTNKTYQQLQNYANAGYLVIGGFQDFSSKDANGHVNMIVPGVLTGFMPIVMDTGVKGHFSNVKLSTVVGNDNRKKMMWFIYGGLPW